MRIGLLTEGGYPYVSGEAGLWCDHLVRGLGQHEFDVYALSRSERQEDEGWTPLPPQVTRVRTAPLWTAVDDGVVHGRRTRRRFAEAYGELVTAVCAGGPLAWPGPLNRAPAEEGTDEAIEADRFGNALHALAELARDEGGLVGALRSEAAVRTLERACRAPGALRAAGVARVPDLLTVTAHLERLLRPLSLDWYGADGLGSVDLCHAAAGGPAALPGLLARRLSGIPLLVTEYGAHLRAHYLEGAGNTPVRALLASFHGRLTAEVYRQAACVTAGDAHIRRWQERCGTDRAGIRTVHPGVTASRTDDGTESGECADHADPYTVVGVGLTEAAGDLTPLPHAFEEIRRSEPRARLRIVGAPAGGPDSVCSGRHGEHGDGGEDGEDAAEARTAAGAVVVLPGVVEGFPFDLVEAMYRGRATVSTDVGAVAEVVGDAGLVVPPCDHRALAEACVALLRDPGRRARLGAAARVRALELFTVERNVAAFHDIYLEIISRFPVRRPVADEAGEPLPFGVPAEAHLPWRWTQQLSPPLLGGPRWAVGTPSGATRPVWAAAAGQTPALRGTGEATR